MENPSVFAPLVSLIPNPSIPASQTFLTGPLNLSLSREHVLPFAFSLTFSLLPPMTSLTTLLHLCFMSLPPVKPDALLETGNF